MAADLMIAQTQAQLSFIGRRIRQLHEQHDAQIATLASRIAELESSITEANVVDKGVWREGIAYRKGEAVTCKGSLWIAQTDTTERPGASPCWRLAVKAGESEKRQSGYLTRDLQSHG